MKWTAHPSKSNVFLSEDGQWWCKRNSKTNIVEVFKIVKGKLSKKGQIPKGLCDYCLNVVEQENLTKVKHYFLCSNCLKKRAIKCHKCGYFVFKDEAKFSSSEGKYYCLTCYKELFFICSFCNQERYKDEMIETSDREYPRICETCYSEAFDRCEECGSIFHIDNMFEVEDEVLVCRRCYDAYYRIIKRYDYVPERFKFNKLAWDNLLYIGFELEVEHESNREEMARKVKKFLESKNVGRYFYIKHDGSLHNGFEIVSQPLTLQFIHKKIPLREILEELKRMKFTSYKSGRCGLHFHLNKNFFSSLEIEKLRMFFATNKKELSILSKRKGNYGYCQFEDYKIHNFLYGTENSSKYLAIRTHVTSKNTLEIRLFRGTLAHGRFLACLQFVDAISHYVKEVSIMSLRNNKSWDDFLKWVKKTGRYEHFWAYINNDKDVKSIVRKEEEQCV